VQALSFALVLGLQAITPQGGLHRAGTAVIKALAPGQPALFVE